MKKLLPLLIVLFAGQLFGQATKNEDPKIDTFSTNYWSLLAGPSEGPKGFTLFSRDIKLNSANQYELWVKTVPVNAAVFNKSYGLPSSAAYVLQYATVDCTKKLLMFEKASVYDSGEAILKDRFSPVFMPTKKARIKPGSIGEAVFVGICVRP